MAVTTELSSHDEVNLGRLVRRLEKSTSNTLWDDADHPATWMQCLATLEKVKYARHLLRNLELNNVDATPQQTKSYAAMKAVLDGVEASVQDVERKLAPQPPRPERLLDQLPLPLPPRIEPTPAPDQPTREDIAPGPIGDLIPSEPGQASPPADLLSPSTEPTSPSDPTAAPDLTTTMPTLLSPAAPAAPTSSTTTAIAPKFLQNSQALQTELSDQLAQMSAQLRRNALHFQDALVKDKAVVEAAGEKVESNLGMLTSTRVRLRDHRGKSGSTTCLVVACVVITLILFIMMVALIRITRR
ncbi:hypothetical protein BD626DRAFT_448859 [Schizophyllum amplum]|uniref:Vesicle transport protein n=1 Tax=Schizophyllum amplum TaxID=97359 RepID=A0A550CZZ5_9AGAR|nr:hypothetical protein BD626DRAFT_448859 [Auriculariopsis ampla]